MVYVRGGRGSSDQGHCGTGNSNLLSHHVTIAKSCFLFEAHPPLSKTDEQNIFILVFAQPERADGTRRSCRHLPDETLGRTETVPELFNTAERFLPALVSLLRIPQ